jgi:hypothetical protein
MLINYSVFTKSKANISREPSPTVTQPVPQPEKAKKKARVSVKPSKTILPIPTQTGQGGSFTPLVSKSDPPLPILKLE